MTDVSTFRLYLLRAGYLLLVVGLGSTIWPAILDNTTTWELQRGVVVSMLGAMSVLAVLGIRYPLQTLPLLFFELTWKSIWLLGVALPLWSAHQIDGREDMGDRHRMPDRRHIPCCHSLALRIRELREEGWRTVGTTRYASGISLVALRHPTRNADGRTPSRDM